LSVLICRTVGTGLHTTASIEQRTAHFGLVATGHLVAAAMQWLSQPQLFKVQAF
jgi:hypothetical protein